MPTFELFFTGLCAFSPGSASKTVILVNARDHHHGGGGHHEPHIAVLLASREAVVGPSKDSTARDADRDLDQGAGNYGYSGMGMVGFSLEGDDLTLSTRLAESFEVKPGPRPDAECPIDNRDGFGWVASMERAESVRIDPQALTSNDSSWILARLVLDQGVLGTARFVGFPFAPWKWRYADDGGSGSSQARAVAEVVHLIGTFSGDTVRITSPLHPRQDIVLHHRGTNRVSAWLVNMPEADILQDRSDDPDRHRHFLHYYRLSLPGTGTRFPHRAGICLGALPPPAPTNPKCPPAQFEG